MAIFIIITIASINIILVCRQNLVLSYSVLTVAIRNPLYVKYVCVCGRVHTPPPHTHNHNCSRAQRELVLVMCPSKENRDLSCFVIQITKSYLRKFQKLHPKVNDKSFKNTVKDWGMVGHSGGVDTGIVNERPAWAIVLDLASKIQNQIHSHL